jgi:hypothetical protein
MRLPFVPRGGLLDAGPLAFPPSFVDRAGVSPAWILLLTSGFLAALVTAVLAVRLPRGLAGASAISLRIASTTPRMPATTSRNASSALRHRVTGRPSFGSSLKPAARVAFQS